MYSLFEGKQYRSKMNIFKKMCSDAHSITLNYISALK